MKHVHIPSLTFCATLSKSYPTEAPSHHSSTLLEYVFFCDFDAIFLLTIFKYLNKILSTSWGSNRLWILCWFQHMQPWAKKTRFYFGNKNIFISLFGIFLIPIWDSQIRFFSQAYRVQLSFVNKKNEIQLLGISWWK